MSNPIEPYDMIQKTNIKEHNDMINKINEIVDVINHTNLDTINTEISALKTKASKTDTEIANIKDKDTTQDTEINGITKNLVSNVTATFDNPSRELKISLGREASPSIDTTVVIPSSSETGQYSAGNGITIDNYQIAVDRGVVALKTDIPVVPDVSEITNRLDTIDGEITGINADITNLTNKNTEQDTAIAEKVAIAQGVENSGKVLGIGQDGNVTLINVGGSSGGDDGWKEIDFNNFPTDWEVGDRVKISTRQCFYNNAPPSSWSSVPSGLVSGWQYMTGIPVNEYVVDEGDQSFAYIPYYSYKNANAIVISYIIPCSKMELNTGTVFRMGGFIFNGGGCDYNETGYAVSNILQHTDWKTKMWRKRAST